MSDVNFFTSIPGLSGLNAEQIGALVGSMDIKSYDDGHVFIEEGKAGDKAFFLIEGEVSVTRIKGAEPRVKEINRMSSGEIFGIISLIDSKERTATCRSRGTSRVASLDRSAFEKLRIDSPEVAHMLQRIISRQISRDHMFFSNEIRDVIFSGKASEALTNQDGIIITDTYRGPDRRLGSLSGYSGPERRKR